MVKKRKLFGIEIPEKTKWFITSSRGKGDRYSLILYDEDGVISIIESLTEVGLYSKVRRELKQILQDSEEYNIRIEECDKDDGGKEIEDINHIIDSNLLLKQIGFEHLPEKYKRTLTYRFGLDGDRTPHTFEESAREFGVTRERIRQIEQKAFRMLKIYKNIKK